MKAADTAGEGQHPEQMISAENISKSYRTTKILENISFRADCGEQVAIIGRNGCGKSTLMQILAGILKPDTGAVKYFGQDAVKKPALFSKYCGYVPQDNPLIEELNVQDNLSLWTGKPGRPEERIVSMFRLDELLKTPVEKLSGGMKRRVSIACAVANWPPVLLMDEPTTGLDYYFRMDIHKWMREYRRLQGILIIATHDEEEMRESSSRMLMKGGVFVPLKTGEDIDYE